jgi:hypothetical protein
MPEILEHIHSIKFVNSLCIILKSQPIDNKLGARILAGKFTVINSDVVKLQGSSLVPPLQDSNPWSARIRPPEEELPALELILQALTAQVAENEQAVQTLKAQVAEYKSAINDYINILGQKGIRINNLEILLESIYRSTSWKITRPIRDAKTFAQKILR